MTSPVKQSTAIDSRRHRIAVMGAGAVGCYYGGLLARAGHEVVLIGRPAHVEAVRAHGLRIETAAFDEFIPLEAATDASAVDGADLVLFCVKSTDTESAAADMLPYLDARALVLTLQNGVDNDIRLRSVLREEVAAAVVYVATAMAGPGHVRHHGRGELVIAPSSHSAQWASIFTAAGIPTQISHNVRGALWAKLVLNCAYNAMSAITALPYGQLVRQPGITDCLADVVAECLAVAQADGIEIPGDIAEAVRAIATTMPGQLSSTAQDLARGKASEIDHLNGYIVRRAEVLDVPVPANRLLTALVKALESRTAVAS